MLDYLAFVLPYFLEYRYLAIFLALTLAGFGVPVPEEVTIVISGYLTAIGQLHLGLALLVCYIGVIAGDLVTYCIGRFAGRYFLETSYGRLIISKKKLEQVQYYYRGYGPYYLLGARQVPGLRFPSFFTAGTLRMGLWKFLLFDGLAGLISMPVVFTIAYVFGPRLQAALDLVFRIRNVTLIVGLSLVGLAGMTLLMYWWYKSKGYELSQNNKKEDIHDIEP